jgi:hypothetical protein
MGAFGEVGAELLRSRRVGILTSVRADLPFYALQQLKNDFANGTIVTTTTESRYVVPLTLNFGVAWH